MLKDLLLCIAESGDKAFIASEDIVTQGVVSAAGSQMLEGFEPPYDASVVQKLKGEGYALLGKARMSEFGLTPLSDELGAHAAAKALMESSARFALASDTWGQLRVSAAKANTLGFKPSYGFVSRMGLISTAASLESIGVISRDLAGLNEALGMIVFKDTADPTSMKGDMSAPNAKIRIGVPDVNDEGVKKAKSAFEGQGFEVKAIGSGCFALARELCDIISAVEFASGAARYDGVKFGLRAESDELNDMYELTRSQGFGEEAKRLILLGTTLTREKYYEDYAVKAMRLRRKFKEGVTALFGECDAWLTPALGNEDAYEYTRAANLCGFPALALPTGVQLMGAYGSDALLIKAAEALLGGI